MAQANEGNIGVAANVVDDYDAISRVLQQCTEGERGEGGPQSGIAQPELRLELGEAGDEVRVEDGVEEEAGAHGHPRTSQPRGGRRGFGGGHAESCRGSRVRR